MNLKHLSLFTWLDKLTSPLEQKHEKIASSIRIGICGVLGGLSANFGYYTFWLFLFWLFASLYIEIIEMLKNEKKQDDKTRHNQPHTILGES